MPTDRPKRRTINGLAARDVGEAQLSGSVMASKAVEMYERRRPAQPPVVNVGPKVPTPKSAKMLATGAKTFAKKALVPLDAALTVKEAFHMRQRAFRDQAYQEAQDAARGGMGAAFIKGLADPVQTAYSASRMLNERDRNIADARAAERSLQVERRVHDRARNLQYSNFAEKRAMMRKLREEEGARRQ